MLPAPPLQRPRLAPTSSSRTAPPPSLAALHHSGVRLARPCPGKRAPPLRGAPSRPTAASSGPEPSAARPRSVEVPQPPSSPSTAPKKCAARPLAARPVIKSFKDKRKLGLAAAVPQWAALLAQFGGKTYLRAQQAQHGARARFLPAVLMRWSHKTLLLHARNVNKFVAWHLETRGPIRPESFMDPDLAENVLVQYFLDLTDGGAAATTPSARWSSLRFLSQVADMAPPLPLTAPAVHNIVLSYRRNEPLQPREPTVYTVEQVRRLETAAINLPGAFDRVIIRNELRKIYAALRQDDSVWDVPSSWTIHGGNETGFLSGTAYKTKSTEATSTRLRQGMPWVAPLAGVSAKPTGWVRGYLDDLAALGLPPDAQFAVPSSKPGPTMGAAEPDEHIAALRRALRLAGFPPDACRRIGHHSAKRTILTWAGTSGMLSKEDREILGHHRSSGNGMTVRAYCRNELSAPVHKLTSVLQAIAEGRFQPDNPPGLQWQSGAAMPLYSPRWDLADEFPEAVATQRSPERPPFDLLVATQEKPEDKPQCVLCGDVRDENADDLLLWCGRCEAGHRLPTPRSPVQRSRCPSESSQQGALTPGSFGGDIGDISPTQPFCPQPVASELGPPAPSAPTEPSARTPIPPDVEIEDAEPEPVQPGTGAASCGVNARDSPLVIVPCGTQGTPRTCYWHIPAPLSSRPWKPGRLVIETPEGPVTSMCDFGIRKAYLAPPPVGLGYSACKVCSSRQERGHLAIERSGADRGDADTR